MLRIMPLRRHIGEHGIVGTALRLIRTRGKCGRRIFRHQNLSPARKSLSAARQTPAMHVEINSLSLSQSLQFFPSQFEELALAARQSSSGFGLFQTVPEVAMTP